MKFKKLNMRGFSHDLVIVVVVVLVAVIGVGYKVASHAAEVAPDLGVNTASGASCAGGLSGWASEGLGSSSETVNVDVYANGPWAINGGGTYVGQTSDGGHGYPATNPSWSMAIPAAYPTKTTTFYIYAINQGGTVAGPAGGVLTSASGGIYGGDPVTLAACATAPPVV